MTSKQENFLNDFKILLDKYNADIRCALTGEYFICLNKDHSCWFMKEDDMCLGEIKEAINKNIA